MPFLTLFSVRLCAQVLLPLAVLSFALLWLRYSIYNNLINIVAAKLAEGQGYMDFNQLPTKIDVLNENENNGNAAPSSRAMTHTVWYRPFWSTGHDSLIESFVVRVPGHCETDLCSLRVTTV